VQTLIEHDLVDELRLKIFPVLLGSGARLFGEINDKKPMRLIDIQALAGGIVYLVYERAANPCKSMARSASRGVGTVANERRQTRPHSIVCANS
jgi:hypothetical protein